MQEEEREERREEIRRKEMVRGVERRGNEKAIKGMQGDEKNGGMGEGKKEIEKTRKEVERE